MWGVEIVRGDVGVADDTERVKVQVQDNGLVCMVRAHGKKNLLL